MSHYRLQLLDPGRQIDTAPNADCLAVGKARDNAGQLVVAGRRAALWHRTRGLDRVIGGHRAPATDLNRTPEEGLEYWRKHSNGGPE